MNPSSEYIIVLVTTPSREVGETLAKTLVKEKLVACINLWPVSSIYTWENQVQTEEEWQMFMKTTGDKFLSLQQRIIELHPYQTPEIIALPIVAGFLPYLQWIDKTTSS